jgi:hypothetical protein
MFPAIGRLSIDESEVDVAAAIKPPFVSSAKTKCKSEFD